MMDQPSAVELVKAVQTFLETRAFPELKGHTAFHARVAANALAIVARELELGPNAAEFERDSLRSILGHDGALEAQNKELCARIRAGDVPVSDLALGAHLRNTTIAKVAIDQPTYSGLKTAIAKGEASPKAK